MNSEFIFPYFGRNTQPIDSIVDRQEPAGDFMSQASKNVTDQTFATEVLQSSLPVLVDYWAPWCAPCKMIGPLLEQSATSYAGRLSVAKIDIDDNPQTPSQ